MRSAGLAALVAASALLGAACATSDVTLESDDDEGVVFADGGALAADGTAVESATGPTSTIPLVDRLPEPRAGLGVLELDGYALPILQRTANGWLVLSPCGNEVTVVEGLERIGAHVVIDPEVAAAPIARAVERRLAQSGVVAVLSRWTNIEIDASTRAALADASGAHAFISLGLVVGDTANPGPASAEVVHQIDSTESRRLAGLLFAELTEAMDALASSWPTLDEAGVRPLLNQRGTDYFVVLRENDEAAAVVVDIPGRTAPAMIELLSTADGQAALAGAIAGAIEQFLGSTAAGSGYIEPEELVRDAPTGGLERECNDPLLPPPDDE